MALISEGFDINITFAGSGGTKDRYTRKYKTDAADAAAAELLLAGLLTDATALSNCVVSGVTITERRIEDAFVAPGVGIYTTDRARITIGIEGHPTKTARIDIPSPKAALFVGNGVAGDGNRTVNTSLAELLAHIARFDASGGADVLVSDGEYANRVVSGKRITVAKYF